MICMDMDNIYLGDSIDLNRRFIGFEKEEKYYDISCKRLGLKNK